MPFRAAWAIALLVVCAAVTARAETPKQRPVPAIQRAVVISIDGCRPDMLLRSNTPTLHHLLDVGSYSFWARTIPESITLPSHTSMLTGVTAQRHGIEWNVDLPLARPIYPAVPTLFEVLKRAGYTTAMVSGKSKFKTLDKPDTIDWVFVPKATTISDAEVADEAEKIIHDHRPDFLFVHLPGVDNVGHASGWGSHEQRQALEQADAAVARVLAAIDKEGFAGSTLVIVSADHGGAGRSHGPDDPRSRHIPWIAAGPGIRKDLDLTTLGDLTINTEDTFATVCYLMGLTVDTRLDGKPVMQIIERQELLHARD